MKPPAFQFYPSDFLASTSEMTCEEVGMYIRLLCHQWIKGGLPDDDGRLLAMAGQCQALCQASSLAYVRQRFGKCQDGALRQGRMEREREKQREFREKQAINGAKRWVGNAKPHDMAEPSHMPNACSLSPSPSLSQSLTTTPNQIPLGDSGTLKPKKLRKPSGGLEEVTAYFGTKSGTKAQAEDFWDWYEGNGWTQGKARTPLSNWQNAANRWIRNAISTPTPKGHHRPTVADERNRFIGGQEIWEATSGKRALEEGEGFGIG